MAIDVIGVDGEALPIEGFGLPELRHVLGLEALQMGDRAQVVIGVGVLRVGPLGCFKFGLGHRQLAAVVVADARCVAVLRDHAAAGSARQKRCDQQAPD